MFMVSRLTALKRADLLLEALARPAAAGVRAMIAGEGEEAGRLAKMVRERALHDRVTLLGRISDEEMLGYYARCRAVVFPPVQEDYGFVTVEAFASRKAVITCRDSGGPAELVVDGSNGCVCDATADGLAAALGRLSDDAALAERLGAAAYDTGRKLNWPDAIRELTA